MEIAVKASAAGGWNSIPFSNSSVAHSVMYAIELLTIFQTY